MISFYRNWLEYSILSVGKGKEPVDELLIDSNNDGASFLILLAKIVV